jgi:hypothetical protein
MTLLEEVIAALDAAGVRHALIGAGALALHGVSRSTLDQDLLVTEVRVLSPTFWAPISSHASVDVRTGDIDDPLAGVVRVRRHGERDVDIVVGRSAWQSDVLLRAERINQATGSVWLVRAVDLVLLKLYAGGSQDRWDIEQLLGVQPREALVRDVDELIDRLPPRCEALWRALRSAG